MNMGKSSLDPSMIAVVSGAVIALGFAAYSYFSSSSSSSSSSSKTSKSKTSKSSSKEGGSHNNYTKSSSTKSKGDDTVVDNSSIGEGSDLRGYKTLEGGKKTSYFHRELSAEEKAILGDCTPKIIDPNSTNTEDYSPKPILQKSDSASSSASVWNTAGTYEEKNVKDFSHAQLSKLLKDIVINISEKFENYEGIKVVVANVKQITGDSVITFTRGKKIYLYDLSVEISWRLTTGSLFLEGNVQINDINGTQDDLEMNITMTSRGDQITQQLYDNFVRGSKSKFKYNLKNSITAACAKFYDDLKAKY